MFSQVLPKSNIQPLAKLMLSLVLFSFILAPNSDAESVVVKKPSASQRCAKLVRQTVRSAVSLALHPKDLLTLIPRSSDAQKATEGEKKMVVINSASESYTVYKLVGGAPTFTSGVALAGLDLAFAGGLTYGRESLKTYFNRQTDKNPILNVTAHYLLLAALCEAFRAAIVLSQDGHIDAQNLHAGMVLLQTLIALPSRLLTKQAIYEWQRLIDEEQEGDPTTIPDRGRHIATVFEFLANFVNSPLTTLALQGQTIHWSQFDVGLIVVAGVGFTLLIKPELLNRLARVVDRISAFIEDKTYRAKVLAAYALRRFQGAPPADSAPVGSFVMIDPPAGLIDELSGS